MKSLPKWIKQISLKCKIFLMEKDVEVSGMAHFKQNELESVLIDIISLQYDSFTHSNELIFKIAMQEQFIYKDEAYIQYQTESGNDDDELKSPIWMLWDDLCKIFD